MEKFIENKSLLEDLKNLIITTKQNVAISVNSALTLMYWLIGFKINEDVLKNTRAEYGNQIVHAVSRQLVEEFGNGFSRANLFHMIKFSQVFDDFEIVSALSGQLSWTHFRKFIYIEDNLKREFYIQMCCLDKWSTRILENRIDSMLYERTVLSKIPDSFCLPSCLYQRISQLQLLRRQNTGDVSLTPHQKTPYIFVGYGFSPGSGVLSGNR